LEESPEDTINSLDVILQLAEDSPFPLILIEVDPPQLFTDLHSWKLPSQVPGTSFWYFREHVPFTTTKAIIAEHQE